MDYISRLNNFDAPDIANIAIGGGLYEEALTIFKKYDQHANAARVLLDNIKDVDRAYEYAERVDVPEVWSRLGKAQLEQTRVKDAITSYIRADDPSNYVEVIRVAEKERHFDDLIRFLLAARKKAREPVIESELLYAYAKTGQLTELEEFISSPNIAQIQVVGERCFEDKLYLAAKLLFSNVNNWAKLATTLVYLGEHQNAVDCARKASSTK
jgi:clathrin heavy chain